MIFKSRKISLLIAFAGLIVAPACVTKESRTGQKTLGITHEAHLPEGWYPLEADALHKEIKNYLTLAINNFYVEADPHAVKALVVPHAGYYYSGLCAATAYQTLLENRNLRSSSIKNKKIKRVVLLAPSHTTLFRGVALPDYTVYKTALGDLHVNQEVLYKLEKNEHFKIFREAHATEHAVEVQLPFLQETIASFDIMPLVVGNLKPEDVQNVSAAIKEIIDDQTLLVISSDFAHHGSNFNYKVFNDTISNQVKYLDSLAVKTIVNPNLEEFENVLDQTGTTICGQNPIKILISMLENKTLGSNLQTRLACYYTSAHLQQARSNKQDIDTKALVGTLPDAQAADSVSYVGLVVTSQDLAKLSKENQLTGYEKRALLKTAQEVVANKLKPEVAQTAEHLLWPIVSPGMFRQAGAFVTLNTKSGNLRGCIGRIMSAEPLFQTVVEMAKSAAFHDDRFSPVTQKDLDSVVFDISVLSPPTTISGLGNIEIGKHGIILKKFDRTGALKNSAVFLPQVPKDFGWTLEETLTQLSIKAGLGADGWKEGCEFQVFEGIEFHE
ncbi:AmmeMemoRadiSam system protein B [Candidatus Babeliales bacterium]|nr:AmmeMemoRadiSam system protein B [Candidatus Babeliales bacterium]